jgi:hypothetical protein
MDDSALAQKIATQLKQEVPAKYASHVKAFEDLVSQNLMRAAYAEADELRRKQDWHPSKELQGMILRFQQVF